MSDVCPLCCDHWCEICWEDHDEYHTDLMDVAVAAHPAGQEAGT